MLTVLYFLFSNQLITIIFGDGYQAASSLLGWMGFAMIGISLSSIWLNYYLAEKPRNFVILLLAAVAFEWILLNLLPAALSFTTFAFGATGWLTAIGGLILYWSRLLRRTSSPLRSAQSSSQ